jgi:hypothetical protein
VEAPSPRRPPATSVAAAALAAALALAGAAPARAQDAGAGPRPSFLVEAGAYYTSAGVYLPVSGDPPPDLGEREEWEFWLALLPRSLLPQFLVLEASVNPMPCLGLLVRDRAPELYARTQLDDGLNLVRAATAGFDEPWAASLFIGNFADWRIAGHPDVEGNGYLGTVVSVGNLHIKDNVAVEDRWLEIEAKVKGDRRSAVKKLSWGFRVGVKLHDHPDVVDGAYVEVRRSRVDYRDGPPLVANSGVSYRFDVALDGRPLKHRLLVDRKWPTRGRATFSLAAGVLWDSGNAYRGALAASGSERVQFLLRPNVEF